MIFAKFKSRRSQAYIFRLFNVRCFSVADTFSLSTWVLRNERRDYANTSTDSITHMLY